MFSHHHPIPRGVAYVLADVKVDEEVEAQRSLRHARQFRYVDRGRFAVQRRVFRQTQFTEHLEDGLQPQGLDARCKIRYSAISGVVENERAREISADQSRDEYPLEPARATRRRASASTGDRSPQARVPFTSSR